MTGGFKGISSSSKTGSTISSSLEQLLVIGIELKCLTFLVFKISQFSHWKKRVKRRGIFLKCCLLCVLILFTNPRGSMKEFFFNIYRNNWFGQISGIHITYTHFIYWEISLLHFAAGVAEDEEVAAAAGWDGRHVFTLPSLTSRFVGICRSSAST